MLPAPRTWAEVDLYDLENWPDDDLRPRKKILQQVQALQAALGEGADHFFLIAGVDQETITNLRLVRETAPDGSPVKRFEYELSLRGRRHGPARARAAARGEDLLRRRGHGSLPNNAAVFEAVRELLDRGETAVLPGAYTPAPYAARRPARCAKRRCASIPTRAGAAAF
jgi:hypothetical protein